MVNAHALSIAVLARDFLQQRILRNLIERSGNRLEAAFLWEDLCNDPDLQQQATALVPDAWILVAGEGGNEEDDWFSALQGITVYCDEPLPQTHEPAYPDWERRLEAKLRGLAGTVNLKQSEHGCAREVWLLAASTGGPAAVKEFLAELPPALDIGFVYAQHIEAGYEDTLAKGFSQDSHYPAYQVRHGCILRPNAVAIVSPQQATELLANGTFLVNDDEWSGPYRPSIDAIVASVARSYGRRSGVIVFTGMGDDGAMSCRLMRKNGGRVWAQSPETCTVDAMPLAAMATNSVEFVGSTRELARQLSKLYSGPVDELPLLQPLTAKTCGSL